jgi:hypothetical protein
MAMSKKIAGSITIKNGVLSIHDPIHRKLIDKNDDDDANDKRIRCIVTYSSSLQIFNLAMNMFHFFAPFIVNLISALAIIIMTTRQRTKV